MTTKLTKKGALGQWTPEQLDVIRKQIAPNCPDEDLKFFAMVCVNHKLDPFIGQIHYVPRGGKWTVQISVDGFRSIAARTGEYAGSDDPVFDNDSNPKKATVTVYRMIGGMRCPFTSTARWNEFFPGEKIGFMWKSKPCVMLGKCAEAQALRKGFPEEMSGIYVEEEMQKDDAKVTGGPQDFTCKEALAAVKKCKDKAELDTLKLRLSSGIGGMTGDDKDKVMDAVTARSAELLGKKEGIHKGQIVDAEVVETEVMEPPEEIPSKVEMVKKIEKCKTKVALDKLKGEGLMRWINTLPADEKDEVIMAGKKKKEELGKIAEVKKEADSLSLEK